MFSTIVFATRRLRLGRPIVVGQDLVVDASPHEAPVQILRLSRGAVRVIATLPNAESHQYLLATDAIYPLIVLLAPHIPPLAKLQ